MDRHDRPYRCEETGCKTIQGFTYPGGLVRHQREVHKTAGLSRVFCPIENCTRSSGLGFTRRENRDEHVRRLHLGKPADAVHSTVRYVDSKKHATSSKADTNIGTGMPEAPMASSVSGIQSSHLQRASKSPGPTTSTKEPRGKDVKDTVKQLEANLDSLMQRNGLISRDYQGLADRLNRLEMKLGKHIVP